MLTKTDIKQIGFTNRVENVSWPPQRVSKADFSSVSHSENWYTPAEIKKLKLNRRQLFSNSAVHCLPVVTARKALILCFLIHSTSDSSSGSILKGSFITLAYTIRLTFLVIWDTRYVRLGRSCGCPVSTKQCGRKFFTWWPIPSNRRV